MTQNAMRLADEVAPETVEQELDLDGFAGTWLSSDDATRGIPRMVLAMGGGTLRGRIYGAGPRGEWDWGEVEAGAVYAESAASQKAAGFVLDYDLGSFTSHVQVNLKLGVAVLGVHHSYRDGRRGRFFREFMARDAATPAGDAPAEAGARDDPGAPTTGRTTDPAPLVGHWRNTQQDPRGLVELVLDPAGPCGVALRVWGAGRREPRAWGEARGELFSCVEEDDVASAAALVGYDFGFMTSELQVRQNKGILAVTTFNRFTDSSGRSDYVTRELFHRR